MKYLIFNNINTISVNTKQYVIYNNIKQPTRPIDEA